MSDPSAYVMGHDDRERRRLVLQASILNPFTDHLLRRAGISAGMRVLDIGCGVGDVSLLAAHIVGRGGRVTSLDFDGQALKTLKERAEAEALGNIECVKGNVHDWDSGRRFDAVIGRHILIHSKNPLDVLQRSAGMLQPRGLAAFHEYDFSVMHRAWPPTPLRDRTMEVFDRFFEVACFSNMGSRLWTLLVDAGFENPDCRAEYPIDGGSDSLHFEWFVESLRSILPRAIALGIVREGEIGIDTLEERLRAENRATKSCVPAPTMIGAFARLKG
ncbi:MAG TPA: methyltransferase domain-containing protein [Bryobacteraceae bacterium]